jgi:GntR family transcriptional regulator/MocR family aminotransferase
MAKHSAALELVLPPQPPGTPAYEWLYDALRTEILDGRLRGGMRLPSTRELGARYGLARGTVVNAFELLKSEGYLRGSTGSGTFVSETLPDDLLTVKTSPAAPVAHAVRRDVSQYGRRVRYDPNFEAQPMRAFRANLPAIDLFPAKQWAALAARRIRNAEPRLFIGCDSAGYAPLCEAVAQYLSTSRGVKCTPENVIIVSGVQEAIDMTARVLLDAGDRVCVEDPGYPGATMVFDACGAKVVPVPVDEEGLRVSDTALRGARLVVVTPAHQSPLGVTMSLRRRLALLEWAQRNDATIFEDDYDSEYRYSSRPVPALQGIDRGANVIFAGSFNKVLFPSLRLGYIVAPPDLADRFAAAKSLTTRHAQLIEQAVLCDFMTQGHFARHLRRMREVYAERLSALVQCIRERLDGVLEVPAIEAGLQTVAWLPHGVDANIVQQRAREAGLAVNAVSAFARRPLERDGLQLGFAAIGTREIKRGVERLAHVMESLN